MAVCPYCEGEVVETDQECPHCYASLSDQSDDDWAPVAALPTGAATSDDATRPQQESQGDSVGKTVVTLLMVPGVIIAPLTGPVNVVAGVIALLSKPGTVDDIFWVSLIVLVVAASMLFGGATILKLVFRDDDAFSFLGDDY